METQNHLASAPANNINTDKNGSAPSDTSPRLSKARQTNSFVVDEKLQGYLQGVTNQEPEILNWIRKTTHDKFAQRAGMLSSTDEGRLLTTVAHMINAKLIVEIGVFTGYSSTAFALGMQASGNGGAGGHIVALDLDEEFAKLARQAWKRAGIEDRIELRLAPAMDSLEKMVTVEADKFLGKVDLVFIDANKENQADYYEYALKLLRPHGVVILDNTLWHGDVYDKTKNDNSTVGVRRANDKIVNDKRVVSVMLPFADGITVVSKK